LAKRSPKISKAAIPAPAGLSYTSDVETCLAVSRWPI
jgi:hypothetical protein